MGAYYFEQGSEDHWKLKRGRPTASQFYRILTPKRQEYAAGAIQYAYQLVGQLFDDQYGLRQDDNGAFLSAAVRNGIAQEASVRRLYEFNHSAEVEQVGFYLSDDERFGCSPDGLVGSEGGVELKCPQPATQVEWLTEGGVPHKHLAQVHGSLLITGRDWWDFMSYSTDELPVIYQRVEPGEYTKRLAECLEQFWDDLQRIKKFIEGQSLPRTWPEVPTPADEEAVYF